MPKAVKKMGDIFIVNIGNNMNKYFQYIANDRTQLGSDVIRVFKTIYPNEIFIDVENIVGDDIDFYAHVVLEWGVRMKLWKKIGSTKNIGDLDIFFRDTNDYGVRSGEKPIAISENWKIWKINEPFISVGRLEGDNRKADIGIVVTPADVLERMQTGKYHFLYPDYK